MVHVLCKQIEGSKLVDVEKRRLKGELEAYGTQRIITKNQIFISSSRQYNIGNSQWLRVACEVRKDLSLREWCSNGRGVL